MRTMRKSQKPTAIAAATLLDNVSLMDTTTASQDSQNLQENTNMKLDNTQIVLDAIAPALTPEAIHQAMYEEHMARAQAQWDAKHAPVMPKQGTPRYVGFYVCSKDDKLQAIIVVKKAPVGGTFEYELMKVVQVKSLVAAQTWAIEKKVSDVECFVYSDKSKAELKNQLLTKVYGKTDSGQTTVKNYVFRLGNLEKTHAPLKEIIVNVVKGLKEAAQVKAAGKAVVRKAKKVSA